MMATLDCEKAERLIHLELDGELREDDARLLEDHLDRCESCRRYREELLEVDRALREGLGAVQLPEPQVDAARREVSRARRRRALLHTWLPAAAAFILVALGLLVGVPMMQRPGPMAAPAVVVSGGDAVHVFAPDGRTAQTGRTGAQLQERSVAWGLSGEPIGLQFADGARVELSDEAVVRIGRTSVDLYKGDLHADLSEATGEFTVVTPWGEFSGPGAAFNVHSDGDQGAARVMVISGQVTVSRRSSTRTLSAGQTARLAPDPQPTIPL